MKKVAILQSNYIPWKGYFDLIASVDLFVIYDDMQYTKRDWRNRNKIKTENGLVWLSIPVQVKGRYLQKINETLVSDPNWAEKHWNIIAQNYRKAPHFHEIASWLKPVFMNLSTVSLSEINFELIQAICRYLKIDTKISKSSDFVLAEGKTNRLVDLANQVGATQYWSGPAARGYLDEKLFQSVNIEVCWFDYLDYPEYPQQYGGFEHSVTILDLLFNVGTAANKYMKFLK